MTDNQFDMDYPSKPDFALSVQRLKAWLEGEIVDRVPVNFRLPEVVLPREEGKSLEDTWMNAEGNVTSFAKSLSRRQLQGETFPIYCPNLGPWISSVVWGGRLVFEDTTSYMEEPSFKNYAEIPNKFQINFSGLYFKKIIEMTELSLDIGKGLFQTGYTDLHGGLDCLSGLRGTENLLMDFYDYPNDVIRVQEMVTQEFIRMFDYFNTRLRECGQLSSNWLNLPFAERMHVPSCDTAYMMSPDQFATFEIPFLIQEMSVMDVNIFHVDGIGVARHIDAILELPGLNAIQWVQGAGNDKPILKWKKLIQKILDKGKSVIAILKVKELEGFIDAFPDPKGILIYFDESLTEDSEREVIRRIDRW